MQLWVEDGVSPPVVNQGPLSWGGGDSMEPVLANLNSRDGKASGHEPPVQSMVPQLAQHSSSCGAVLGSDVQLPQNACVHSGVT